MDKLKKARLAYKAALEAAKTQWDGVKALCETEGRDPTDEERAAADNLMEAAETAKAVVIAAEKDVEREERIARTIREASRANIPLPQPGASPFPELRDDPRPAISPAVAKQRSQVFETGADAYGFFRWIKATQYHDQDSIQWCRDQGIPIGASMSTVTNAAGGAAVPEAFNNSIINLVEDYGVFRRWSNYVPMSSETEVWPRVLSGQTVYFPAQNTAVTSSDLALDNISLTAKELACLTLVSRTLSEDSAVAMADLIASRAANAIANKEDSCGFLGDGTSTYGGIYGVTTKIADGNHTAGVVTAATGNTAFSTLDMADFEGMVGALPNFPGIRPAWFISKPGYAASMARLSDSAGGNTRADIASGSPYEFLGYPVVITQVMNSTLTAQTSTASICLFGDLRMTATMGYRRQMVFETDSGGKYFENRQTAMLMSERIDINVHDLGDTSNAGPMIALDTPSS